MAHLDPNFQFEQLKKNLIPAVQELFPVIGKTHTLRLDKVWVDDTKHLMDIQGQKESKLAGRTWAVPVYGSMSLVDNATGKVLDQEKKLRLISLPKITHRFSYIIGGKEYQTLTQFLRRPGVYSQVAQNGLLVSQFNLARKGGAENFNISFDPKTKLFTAKYRNSEANIRLYHMLQAMGVTDKQLEASWGPEILATNKSGNPLTDIKKLHNNISETAFVSAEDTAATLRGVMEQTVLDPETTSITLGKAFTKVEGDTLLRSTQKLLGISRNEIPVDDMHSLVFKKTHAIEDFIPDRLRKMNREIRRRVFLNLDRKMNVTGVMSWDVLNRPVQTFFTIGSGGLASTPEQVNPLEMVSGQSKSTVMGAGGIGSEYMITRDEKAINPSHLGFLDPVQTPEGPRIGAVLSIPLGAVKKGTDLVTSVYDLKTGKDVQVKPYDVYTNLTVFPDQVTWAGGKPKAIGPKIKATVHGNMEEVPLAKARYVIKSAKGLFGVASNLIPFMQNNMGNRAVTGSRQQEQAISLVHREAPLIQAGATPTTSFESLLGQYFAATSPVAGTVSRVNAEAITLKDSAGKLHKVALYDHFPMNDGKSFFHSEPLVKSGDKVKAGQVLADTNFTKGGVLSLGTNLLTAYIPFHGYNFEDGIVISESAAKKLSSHHLHRLDITVDDTTALGKARFMAYRRKDLSPEMAAKLDDDGVVKKGQRVKPGDIVIAALAKRDSGRESSLLAKISRGRISPFKNASVTWNEGYEGEVVDIVKGTKSVDVFIKTVEPAIVGDKIVGRHGNKGIITLILPDNEIPHTKDGRPMDILLNPTGVPGRVNLGQVLETAAAKAAEKQGKPILIQNFSHTNSLEEVRSILRKAGISDKETLIDPLTKRPLGEVLVGPQYILKLKHQVGTKLRARSRDEYDINNVPQRGGPHGGQSLGSLGIYGLLAHGARAMLRESATYKSDFNDDFWHALQSGEPLPPPRSAFTYDKFTSYLKGSGINIHKEGNSLILIPLTDDHVKKISAGALPNPSMVVRGKDLAPIKGGLFDYNLTGGPGGLKWSHIHLAEPLPNPVFEGAIKALLGLTEAKFHEVLSNEGGRAMETMLGQINPAQELPKLRLAIKTAPVSKVDDLNNKIKILEALQAQKMDPRVYMLRNIPVLPPRFRPMTPRPDGSLNVGDLNGLYKNLGEVNETIFTIPSSAPSSMKAAPRAALYDAVKALTMAGGDVGGKQHKGILSIIAGTSSPKGGYFQDKVIRRREDLTMRSTIVPEPKLGLDEVGLPEEGAWEMYKPFILRYLKNVGIPPLRALEEIKNKTPQARLALNHVMSERPVLLKRDPVLHKFSIMAFKPVLHSGRAIKIHPLVTGGFNADFDGDTMAAFVPVTHEAVEEARKMYPSNNLFSSTTGLLMNKLTHESLLGTYMLSEWGKTVGKTFKTKEEATKAATSGQIGLTDVIRVGSINTTLGRTMLADTFPPNFKIGNRDLRTAIMADKNFVFDRSKISSILTELAKSDKYAFSETVGKIQNLGSGYTYATGFSIGLDDLTPASAIRDKVLGVADAEVHKIRQSGGSRLAQDKKVVQVYDKATQDMESQAKKHFDKTPNNMYTMVRSGARGNWDQFKQMTVAPMLVRNAKGEIIPVPIKRSYSEGLDTADYWTALHGGREGIVQKVIGTSEPGAFSKTIMASTINMLITENDCGTNSGTFLPTSDTQVLGRFLAQPIKIRNKMLPRNTLVTSELVTRLQNNKVDRLLVRSPLRCQAPHGICQKCYGLNEYGQVHSLGTNIGALAGQAIGEPATQLALKSFHTAGVVGAQGQAKRTDSFARINQILAMPKIMPTASVLAQKDGSISKISPDPAGGWSVYVGDEKHYVPATRELVKDLKVGTKVRRGESISDGDIHPVDLLRLTNINTVQEYLTNELFRAYQPVGPVRRSNIETVVKTITNLAYVEDPGDHPDFVRGDYAPVSKITALNRTALKGRRPIVFQPVLRPIKQLPLDISTDWLARLNFQRLKDTLVDGAQRGWSSAIHQTHPIPGLAYAAEFGKGTKQAPWLY